MPYRVPWFPSRNTRQQLDAETCRLYPFLTPPHSCQELNN
jgi:hypothetical protein